MYIEEVERMENNNNPPESKRARRNAPTDTALVPAGGAGAPPALMNAAPVSTLAIMDGPDYHPGQFRAQNPAAAAQMVSEAITTFTSPSKSSSVWFTSAPALTNLQQLLIGTKYIQLTKYKWSYKEGKSESVILTKIDSDSEMESLREIIAPAVNAGIASHRKTAVQLGIYCRNIKLLYESVNSGLNPINSKIHARALIEALFLLLRYNDERIELYKQIRTLISREPLSKFIINDSGTYFTSNGENTVEFNDFDNGLVIFDIPLLNITNEILKTYPEISREFSIKEGSIKKLGSSFICHLPTITETNPDNLTKMTDKIQQENVDAFNFAERMKQEQELTHPKPNSRFAAVANISRRKEKMEEQQTVSTFLNTGKYVANLMSSALKGFVNAVVEATSRPYESNSENSVASVDSIHDDSVISEAQQKLNEAVAAETEAYGDMEWERIEEDIKEESQGSAPMNTTGGYRPPKSKRSKSGRTKSRKITSRRRVTRNRRKNLRSTRYRKLM